MNKSVILSIFSLIFLIPQLSEARFTPLPKKGLIAEVLANNVVGVKHHISVRSDLGVKDAEGYTALMIAAQAGSEEIVRLLLEAGADIFAKNNKGQNVINVAARAGHGKIVDIIIDHMLSKNDAKKSDPRLNAMIQEARAELHGTPSFNRVIIGGVAGIATLAIGLGLWLKKKTQSLEHDHIV
jgi:hypothetical protein